MQDDAGNPLTNSTRVLVNGDSGELLVRAVTQEDTANYTCRATNVHGSVTYTGHLKVFNRSHQVPVLNADNGSEKTSHGIHSSSCA